MMKLTGLGHEENKQRFVEHKQWVNDNMNSVVKAWEEECSENLWRILYSNKTELEKKYKLATLFDRNTKRLATVLSVKGPNDIS